MAAVQYLSARKPGPSDDAVVHCIRELANPQWPASPPVGNLTAQLFRWPWCARGHSVLHWWHGRHRRNPEQGV